MVLQIDGFQEPQSDGSENKNATAVPHEDGGSGWNWNALLDSAFNAAPGIISSLGSKSGGSGQSHEGGNGNMGIPNAPKSNTVIYILVGFIVLALLMVFLRK